MDAEERARRFAAAAEAELASLPRIQRDVLAEIIRQLQAAQKIVIDELAANPSESAQRRLRQLRAEVERNLEDFRSATTTAATGGADKAWAAGVRGVTAPMEAAGVNMLGARIDARALLATKQFLTSRIEDISLRAVDKLNGALTQHIIGTRSLSDTITDVQRVMGGVPRARAMTVTYTEIGRAHAIAQDDALQDAGAIVPGLRKRWLQSGKLHMRAAHMRANNQIRAYNDPYLVDGEHLRFPRDPNGSAGNTINCGCHSIPVVDGSSFGASTVRIGPQGGAQLERPDGTRVRLPK